MGEQFLQPATFEALIFKSTLWAPALAAVSLAALLVSTQPAEAQVPIGAGGRLPQIPPTPLIDKVNAQVFAYYGAGILRGPAPALLGMARGDDSVPGIGQRKLATITPAEHTTPAGRFEASLENDFEPDGSHRRRPATTVSRTAASTSRPASTTTWSSHCLPAPSGSSTSCPKPSRYAACSPYRSAR